MTSPAASAGGSGAGSPSGTLASGTVVYVLEPDGTESAAICTLVRRLGASPRPVADLEALVAARPGPGSCVVAEMRLPGGDGLALLKALQSAGSVAPVIFVTGDRDVGRAVVALRAGAADYLVKPWVEQRLATRLRAALGLGEPGGA